VTGSTGGDIGKVDDLLVDPTSMQARYLVVELDGEARRVANADSTDPVLVPVNRARIDQSDKRVRLDSAGASLAQLPRYRGEMVDRDYNDRFQQAEAPTPETGSRRMTLSAEELRIGKRRVQAGEVTVQKHVETEHVKEPVTRMREEVTIERRAVSDAHAGATDIREDEVRIPITEEELIVEKRPVVKEEVVIGKRQVQDTETVEADLKRERVDVDRDGRREHLDDASSRGRRA
jgi:uncharacterized protein (TIGR02271 family)